MEGLAFEDLNKPLDLAYLEYIWSGLIKREMAMNEECLSSLKYFSDIQNF